MSIHIPKMPGINSYDSSSYTRMHAFSARYTLSVIVFIATYGPLVDVIWILVNRRDMCSSQKQSIVVYLSVELEIWTTLLNMNSCLHCKADRYGKTPLKRLL